MNPPFQKSLVRLFIVSLIVKLILATILPLTSDEAYYWFWSHHMQLSFFDHPPAVAWLFWLAHPLEGLGSAVRLPAVLLSHATLGVWLFLLRRYFSDEQLKIWLWLALLSPLIGAGSLLITPDIPLLFFWALTLYAFINWSDRPNLKNSIWLGLFCGFGFCSKYVMVLEPLLLFFVCVYDKNLRKPLLKYAGVIIAAIAIGSLPVLIWNYQHDFISFRFQANHGLGRHYYKPSWTYLYILGQIGLIFPPILYWSIKGSRRAPHWLVALAWGPLLFFVVTSFKAAVEANWPITSYAEVFALAVLWQPRMSRAIRATLALWGGAIVLMFLLITTRWSPTGEPIKTREFFEFEVLRPIVATHQPIYARSYQMAAKLSFDLKRPIYKLKTMNRVDFYDFLDESTPKADSFFVLAEPQDLLPPLFQDQGYKIVSKQPIADSNFVLWEVRK